MQEAQPEEWLPEHILLCTRSFGQQIQKESASTNVLAGMDQAIDDGVDIMSLSLRIDQARLLVSHSSTEPQH